MPNEIKELIDEILTHLSILQRKVIKRIQPGISIREIEEKTNSLSILFPDGLFELYTKINGTKFEKDDLLDDCHFFPGFYILSLEDSINLYLEFLNYSEWKKGWFPLFANDGGDFYAVQCEKETNDWGQIVGFLKGEESHEIEFESLFSMLSTIELCFQQEVFFVSPEGWLEMDDEKQMLIAKSFNPNVEYYH